MFDACLPCDISACNTNIIKLYSHFVFLGVNAKPGNLADRVASVPVVYTTLRLLIHYRCCQEYVATRHSTATAGFTSATTASRPAVRHDNFNFI